MKHIWHVDRVKMAEHCIWSTEHCACINIYQLKTVFWTTQNYTFKLFNEKINLLTWVKVYSPHNSEDMSFSETYVLPQMSVCLSQTLLHPHLNFNGLVWWKILTGNYIDFPMFHMGVSCNFSLKPTISLKWMKGIFDGKNRKNHGFPVKNFPFSPIHWVNQCH